MRGFPTGVTVVTTRGPAGEYGLTANSFSAVSLEPPLVLVCVGTQGRGSATIVHNRCFAVNLLAADQEPLSRRFASSERPRGAATFAGIAHASEQTGAPILDGACGYLDCRLAATHAAGDHVILVGEVVALGEGAGATPLLFHDGRYRLLEVA
ncbi:MAG TPA: flavin reductase family protein [Microbacterium sp.]|nr:flavin reductase family protein [Microbacterium sp.]